MKALVRNLKKRTNFHSEALSLPSFPSFHFISFALCLLGLLRESCGRACFLPPRDHLENDVFALLFSPRKVRVSGLKLLLGVVADGASPSAAAAAAGGGSPTPIHDPPEPLISDLSPGGSGDTTVRISEGRRPGEVGRGGGPGPRGFELQGRQQRVGRGDNHVGEGAGTAGILSPAVVSRAKHLLVGVSNIDESADVRRLAAQALAALGGTASP